MHSLHEIMDRHLAFHTITPLLCGKLHFDTHILNFDQQREKTQEERSKWRGPPLQNAQDPRQHGCEYE